MAKVKIRDRDEIVFIERVRCPKVGTYVKYHGRRCLVLLVEFAVY